MRVKASPTRAVQSSGSIRSAIDVEPAMSANSTVSGRRSLDPVGRTGGAASGALTRPMLGELRGEGYERHCRELEATGSNREWRQLAGDLLADVLQLILFDTSHDGGDRPGRPV